MLRGMGYVDKYKERADADRAEVTEWFKSREGQWVLWLVLGGIAVWLVVLAVLSVL
jgi:hypothetical protein